MTTSDPGSAQGKPGQAAGSSFTTDTSAGTSRDAPGAPGGFGYQGGQGFGYQGTPAPTGYQGDPSQFPARYAGNWIGGPGGVTRQRISGGINRSIVATMSGPGPQSGRRGRSRTFRYIRMAFWLIGIGVLLYVFVFRHGSFVNCNTDCNPGG
jgi:hypothetical protein